MKISKFWKSSIGFSFFTLISRVFGYIRDLIFAAMLGASAIHDVFVVVFKIPNVFRSFFGEGALSQSLTPSIIEAREHAKDFLNQIFTLLFASLVLFVTSIPDHDVDKEKGRRTLIIIFGKANAVKTFLIFPILAYGIIIYGVVSGLFPIYSLIVLLAKPFLIMAILHLKDLEKSENILLSSMTNTLYFSRIAGALFVISFLIGF